MILMYHNIVSGDATEGLKSLGITMTQRTFRKHVAWLKRKFEIVSLSDYLMRVEAEGGVDRNVLALTLDDGHGVTYDCARSVSVEYNVPMTIFVSTCQIDDGPLIWGMYINAISTECIYDSINVEGRVLDFQTAKSRKQSRQYLLEWAFAQTDIAESVAALEKEYPLPADVMRHYRGMTSEQLRDAGAGNLIGIGSHTVSHPFLDAIEAEAVRDELLQSKLKLEGIIGAPVKYVAYPSGGYNSDVIGVAKAVGYEAGFAVTPRNLSEEIFEIPRVGIYRDSIALLRLSLMKHRRRGLFKTQG